MPTTIEQFAGEHFVLNSISERRQKDVRMGLAALERFTSKPAEQTTADELRAWLVSLMKTRAPSTVAWYLRMVTPFFAWCWQRRLIGAEELMRLREVPPPRGYSNGVPRPYSRRELKQMWAELDARWPYQKEPILKRWRRGTSPYRSVKKHAMRLQLDAIVELALVCGLRQREIYHLSIDDCHWDNYYIVVHGKRIDQNPRVREVPFPESTRKALRAWIRLRVLIGPEPGLPLWLSLTGPNPAAGLSTKRMARILHSFGDWQLHRLRHTCATERLRAGMALEELRDFLGHANIGMTLRYAQLLREDIHKASERIDADFQRAIRPAA